ncbi:MAG: carboxypeptidase-like regulatory domain-containing protein [Cryomorphaceae bacterium]
MSRLVLLSAALFFSMHTLAQTADLAVDGVVYGTKGLPLKGVSVVLRGDQGSTLQQTETRPNGRFSFELSFDLYTEIILSKPGHAPKMLVLDTRNLSDEDKQYNYEYGGFRITLEEGDDSIRPKLVARVHFDANLGNFNQQAP